MTMLSNHLVSNQTNDHLDSPSTSCMAGICYSISLISTINSMNCWIIDSGASQHICSNASMFTFLKPITNVTANFPNGTRIPISLSGDIELSSKLKLKNVLFVPSFSFNLPSVSALVSDSHLTVSFFTGHFVIQDQVHKEMIGKGDIV